MGSVFSRLNMTVAGNVVQDFIDEIIKCDKDGLFWETMDIEGSVKTNLKVDLPDEFDFSWRLLLKSYSLSRHGDAIINEACRDHTHKTGSACLEGAEWEHIEVKIPKKDVSRYCVHSTLEDFDNVKTEDCLTPRAISEYLHTCVTKAKSRSDLDVVVCKRVYGPAVRFSIKAKEIKHRIYVDITPRIDVSFSKLQQRTRHAIEERIESFPEVIQRYIHKKDTIGDPGKLYLVPKNDDAWVLSFANYENLIINKFGKDTGNYSKTVMRHVKKKLNKWKKKVDGKSKLVNVSSYLLKTLFLEMIVEKPTRKSWLKKDIGKNTKDMLRRLRKCSEKGKLPAFFDRGINLLENVSKRSLSNLTDFITNDKSTDFDQDDDDFSKCSIS